MSDSDDAYGPPLPPGLKQPIKQDSESDDEFGPALPPAAAQTSSDNFSKPSIGPVLPPGLKSSNDQTSDSDSDSSSSSDSDSRGGSKKRRSKKRKDSSSDDDKNRPACRKKRQRKQKYSNSDSSSDSDNDRRNKSRVKHSSDKSEDIQRQFIGPVIPGMPTTPHHDKLTNIGPAPPNIGPHMGPILPDNNQDSSDDNDIGPSIGLKAGENDLSAAKEFEARSEKMKERLSGKVEEKAPERETWMTELPGDMGAKFGLDNRQFRKNAALEKDQSWTETPEDKEKKKEGKKKKQDKGVYFKTEEDKKAAKEIESYNKKFRKESLMEMHKKELKKKKKKEEKKKKKDKKRGKDKAPERVAFDRERDLKVNRLDEAQKNAFIKRSQELGSRFKSGGTTGSFL